MFSNKLSSSRSLAVLFGLFESNRLFIGAIHAFYLISTGITLTQLAILQVYFSSTIVLLEYPSGVLADKFTYKIIAITGCMLIAFFYPLSLFAPNMTLLIIAQIVYGAGMCFISGSYEGWLIETIKNQHDEAYVGQLNYYSHLRNEISGMGCMITGLLGAILSIQFGFAVVYKTAFMCAIILTLCFMRLPCSKKYRSTHVESHSIQSIIKTSWQYIFNTTDGLYYLLISCCFMIAYQPIYHFWQPLVLGILQDRHRFNCYIQNERLILGLVFFTISFSIYACNKFIKYQFSTQVNMFTIGISFGVFAAIAAFAIGFEVMNILSFLLLFSLIHGALSVMLTITNNKMLKLIHTDFIASVCSVRTFYQRITAIITLAFLSATLTSHNLKAIFGLCGFVILFITLLLYLWSRNYNLYKLTEEKSCSQLS